MDITRFVDTCKLIDKESRKLVNVRSVVDACCLIVGAAVLLTGLLGWLTIPVGVVIVWKGKKLFVRLVPGYRTRMTTVRNLMESVGSELSGWLTNSTTRYVVRAPNSIEIVLDNFDCVELHFASPDRVLGCAIYDGIGQTIVFDTEYGLKKWLTDVEENRST